MDVYLDWAATAVPDKEIIEKTCKTAVEVFGNPSSLHRAGTAAGKLLEESRERCAKAFGIDKKHLFFTSGGTESNNIALLSLLRKKSRGSIISANIEHSSVYEPLKVLEEAGFTVTRINPEPDGIVDPEKIAENLSENTVLVSLMHVNNETGAIQPVTEVSKAVKSYSRKTGKKILFHCDGVQAAGKIVFPENTIQPDFYTASSHKISGPKGVGLLVCKGMPGPIFTGGGQESGVRARTENLPAIFGFSLAAEKAFLRLESSLQHAKSLSDILIEKLSGIKGCGIIPSSRAINNNTCHYSPYIINFHVAGIPAEVLARVMSEKGFFISSGAACSSRKKGDSRTLSSMRIQPHISKSSVRVSTGHSTSEKEILDFCEVLEEESKKLFNVYK